MEQTITIIELHQHDEEHLMEKLQNYHKKMIERVE